MYSQAPEAGIASLLASRGRNGDSMLVHMTPEEVQGLQGLALAAGGNLSINPQTGLYEANILKKLLPVFAGGVLKSLFPGLSDFGASLLVGGASALIEGDLQKGIKAGMGAYSGSRLTNALRETGLARLGQATAETAPLKAENLVPKEAPAGISAVPYKAGAMPYVSQTVTPQPAISPGTPPAPLAFAPTRGQILGQGLKGLFSQEGFGTFRKALGGPYETAFAISPILSAIDESEYERQQRKFKQQADENAFSYYIPGAFDYKSRTFAPGQYVDTKGNPYKPKKPFGFAEGGLTDRKALKDYYESLLVPPDPMAGDPRRQATLDYLNMLNASFRGTGAGGASTGRSAGSYFQGPSGGGGAGGGGGGGGGSLGGGTGTAGAAQTTTTPTEPAKEGKASEGLVFDNPPAPYVPQYIDVPSSFVDVTEEETVPAPEPEASVSLEDEFGRPIDPTGYFQPEELYTPTQEDIISNTPGQTAFEQYQEYYPPEPAGSVRLEDEFGRPIDPTGYFQPEELYQPVDQDLMNELAKQGQESIDKILEAAKTEQIPLKSDPEQAEQIRQQMWESYGYTGKVPPEGFVYTPPDVPTEVPVDQALMDELAEQGRQGMEEALADVEPEKDGLMDKAKDKFTSWFEKNFKDPYGAAGNILGATAGPFAKIIWDELTPKLKSYFTKPMELSQEEQASEEILKWLKDEGYEDVVQKTEEVPKQKSARGGGGGGGAPIIRGGSGITLGLMNAAGRSGSVTPEALSEAEQASEEILKWLRDQGYQDKAAGGQIKAMQSGGIAALPSSGMISDHYNFGFARGGMPRAGEYAAGGKLLRGPGDGMSDDIIANIEGRQEARLADGEFVIPADVVSHLGNGSTDAGAKKLYQMMDKIRAARTGRKRQAPEVNPNKYLPA